MVLDESKRYSIELFAALFLISIFIGVIGVSAPLLIEQPDEFKSYEQRKSDCLASAQAKKQQIEKVRNSNETILMKLPAKCFYENNSPLLEEFSGIEPDDAVKYDKIESYEVD